MAPKKKGVQRAIAEDNPNRAATVIRLDPALLEALDEWARALSKNGPPQWSRTDVIRATLQRAVRERGAKGEAP
jgi:hypothetical protein